MEVKTIFNVDQLDQNITGGENMTPGEPYNGLGHMSDVPVAAFDPVFWLHHW